MSTLGILGGGSFGVGLARAAERAGNDVILFSRKSIALPRSEKLRPTSSLADLAKADLVLFAVPSSHVRDVARELGHHLDGRHFVVHVSRGLVGDDLKTVSE